MIDAEGKRVQSGLRIFADSGYAGEKVNTATSIAVEIVRKNPDQIGFAVDPLLGRGLTRFRRMYSKKCHYGNALAIRV
jgi:hypothetical protein